MGKYCSFCREFLIVDLKNARAAYGEPSRCMPSRGRNRMRNAPEKAMAPGVFTGAPKRLMHLEDYSAGTASAEDSSGLVGFAGWMSSFGERFTMCRKFFGRTCMC
jgi:hypothetical protein